MQENDGRAQEIDRRRRPAPRSCAAKILVDVDDRSNTVEVRFEPAMNLLPHSDPHDSGRQRLVYLCNTGASTLPGVFERLRDPIFSARARSHGSRPVPGVRAGTTPATRDAERWARRDRASSESPRETPLTPPRSDERFTTDARACRSARRARAAGLTSDAAR